MSNELRYVDYDFEELVAQLTARLDLYATWKDKNNSATGQFLIDLYAYMGNLILYYIERRANETFLNTAKLRSSLINLVSLLGYQPRRKVSARGKVRFSVSPVLSANVFIPRYTIVQSISGVSYMVQNDVVLFAAGSYVDADIVEGSLNVSEVYANGANNFEYNLKVSDLENTWIYVYVNGEVWTQVSSFVDSINTSKHYRVRANVDGTISFVFGNNVFGKSLAAGDYTLIRTIVSSGEDGNVYEASKITTVSSTIYDEDGNLVTLLVTNADTVVGGMDEESDESVKNAPVYFRTGDRAITAADFQAMLEAYAGVETSKVWGERDETPPEYDMFNTVKMTMVLQNWLAPGTQFKSDITEYLYTKAPLTVKLEFVDPVIILVVPEVTLRAIAGYTLSEVQSDVIMAVEALFVLGGTTKLGVSKYISDIADIIAAVDGVLRYYLSLKVKKILTLAGTYSAYNSYTGTLPALPAVAGSLTVYVGNTAVGVDDGAGAFTATDSYYTVSGTVDYVTGAIALDVESQIADVVSIRYLQNQSGDIIVSKQQILKLDVVDVIATTYA